MGGMTSAATRRAVPTVPGGQGQVRYANATRPAAYSVQAQPEATREEALAGAGFDDSVADYQRRVAINQPYEDAIDREEFRRRYGV